MALVVNDTAEFSLALTRNSEFAVSKLSAAIDQAGGVDAALVLIKLGGPVGPPYAQHAFLWPAF